VTAPRQRPLMARFGELYTAYRARGEPDAKIKALADAQYEADERYCIQHENDEQ
jgi:hypothetical protein